MVGTFVGNYLASFATFPYLTRVLGPTHFGILSYAMAMAAYGILLTEWGFNLSGPKAVVDCRGNRQALHELIWSVVGAKACLCVVSFVVLALLFCFNRHLAESGWVVLWSWLGVVANVLTLYWLFQGLERFRLIAAMVFANRMVTLPLTFLLVHGPDDVAIAAAIQASGPVISALLSVVIAGHRGLLCWPSTSPHAIWRRLKGGADMFVATASISLFGVANTVILASFAGPFQVGIYAAADKIKTVGNLVPAQLCSVLYPRVTAILHDNPKLAAKLTLIGAAVTVLITLAGVAFFGSFSEWVTRIVLGGEFHGASAVLVVLCCSTLFGNLAYFLGLQVLVPFGESRKRSLVILGAGIVNVALSLALTPHYGAMGAAVSFLIAEALVLVVYVVSIARVPRACIYFRLGLER